MHVLPGLHERLRRMARRVERPAMRRAAWPAGGILLIVSLIAVLLGFPWSEASSTSVRAEPQPTVTAEPEREVLGAAIARLDGERLTAELVRLAVALWPAPTPTASPTPTPTPEPIVVDPTPAGRSLAPPSAPPAPPGGTCSASMSGRALSLFNAMNAARSERGIPPLIAHSCATYVGQLRSSDMARRNYFSHTSPEGETSFSLLEAYGVGYGWAGENLARNSYPGGESVTIALRDFMADQAHRDNVLSTNFTHAGIGVALDGAGMAYFTVIFLQV